MKGEDSVLLYEPIKLHVEQVKQWIAVGAFAKGRETTSVVSIIVTTQGRILPVEPVIWSHSGHVTLTVTESGREFVAAYKRGKSSLSSWEQL